MSLPGGGHDGPGNGDLDNVNIVSQQNVRIPQFWPHKIVLWFKLLEAYFTSARIVKDETKFSVTIANLGEKYIELIEDVVLNPPDEGQYEALKRELIKRLAESDNSRVRKLMESEEIGDRTPSQFFRDLKKLATASTPDDFIITLWKNRLPANTQRVLAVTSETNITALTEMADRIHEIRPEGGSIASVSGNSEICELREQIKQLRLQIGALTKQRRRSLSRSGQRRRSRSREGLSHSKEGSRSGLCWYHENFKERATKCRAPCTWVSGNEKSRP
ncbi:uncharacterized protein LOC143185946 [Calliopsis andreniformis]|uniref:uncharacterized protein LOC143185946 n=1 Tax=Calliopsis andreniformis TaxID=337506 RepID=UPI003FCD47BD